MAGLAGRTDSGHARRHRERDGSCRRQPHHRRRAVSVGRRFPPARSASTSRARRSCRASSTCTRTSAGESSGILAQASWPLAANLAFGVTTSHDPSNDTETVFTNAELMRAGAEARAAPLLDRHDSLRRRDAVQGRRRDLRRCAVAPAAAEGGGRVQREELQPAAARRAADDHQGGARAGDAGRARRRSLLYMNQTHDARRPHRRRALAAGAAHSTRTRSQLFAKSTVRLHADAHRRLRRPVGRVLLVSAHQRVGERAAADASRRAKSSMRGRAAG